MDSLAFYWIDHDHVCMSGYFWDHQLPQIHNQAKRSSAIVLHILHICLLRSNWENGGHDNQLLFRSRNAHDFVNDGRQSNSVLTCNSRNVSSSANVSALHLSALQSDQTCIC